ncbi:MAG: CPBP family intramembrane metalloprotease [Lachnospiraceae bacterium]|nr:CPBP family intramembrane metalloprotease [Lachnospiraceae bacterium]MBP3297747.1 CPBP family intramembrane metalloprotease [Lachnospiraceae bacterium]
MAEKTKKHSLCEKKPYIAMILGMIIPAVLVGIGGGIGDQISPEAGYIGICVFAVIMMLIFTRWFSPEFKGFVKTEASGRDVLIVMGLFAILEIFTVLEPLFLQRDFYFQPSFRAVLMGLAAGFGEETIFRIVTLAIVMRYISKEKRFVPVIILAVIFGLAHAGNVTQGADPVMTVVQVIHSTFMAFLFTEMYLGTGSALFPVLAHGLHDFICFVTDPSLSEEGILTQQYSTEQLLLEVIAAVIIGVIALCLLGKNKLSKANEIWDKKWNSDRGEA